VKRTLVIAIGAIALYLFGIAGAAPVRARRLLSARAFAPTRARPDFLPRCSQDAEGLACVMAIDVPPQDVDHARQHLIKVNAVLYIV